MNVVKLSLIALAVAAASSQLAFAGEQQESKGFIEDSTLNLLNRNIYINRDFRNGGSNSQGTNRAKPADERNGYREEWAQGLHAEFASGYTQGTVGVGVDAHAFGGIKLDSGRGRAGTGLLPISNNKTADAEVPDSYGEVGGALKARLSSTELKWGELRTGAPVFATADSRLLPETATGLHLSSGDIAGLSLEAGHFTAYNFRDSTNSDDSLHTNYSDTDVRSLDFVGGSYSITDDLSVMLYTSEAEDHWYQHYANANYNIGLAEDQSLNFDFNVYRTDSTGEELAGEVSNTTWSLAAAYKIGAHKFTLAHQQVNGDTPFDYVGGDSIFLANAVQISDFNAPGMKSLQARYDLDLATFGVPGLTFMTRYITGQGSDDAGDYSVDGDNFAGGGDTTYGGYNNAKWHELDIDVKYVLQEGPAKDLSLRARAATYRGNSEASNDYSDINEFRLIVEYPLSIL